MTAKRLLAALVVLMLSVSVMAADAYYGARMGLGINLSRFGGKEAGDAKDDFDKADLKYKQGASFDFAPFFVLQLADAFALQTEMYFTNAADLYVNVNTQPIYDDLGFIIDEDVEINGSGFVDKDGNGSYETYRTILVPLFAKVTLLDRKLGIFAGPFFRPARSREVVIYDKGDKKEVWKDAGQSVGLGFGADFGFDAGPGKLFFDIRYLTSLGAPRWTKRNSKGEPDGWEKDKLYTRFAKLAFSVGYEFGGSK